MESVQIASSRRGLFLDWLLRPARECWQFMVVGSVAWLLLFGMTRWTDNGWWSYLPVLLVDLYLVALLVCSFPRRWRGVLFVLIYITMYISGVAESFLYQRYFTHFTPQSLAMVRETTPEETEGFLRLCVNSPKLWWTLIWWSILLVVHGLIACLWRKVTLGRRLAGEVLVLVTACLLWWIPSKMEVANFLMLDRTEKAERTDNTAFYSTPWRVVYSMKFEQLARKELRTLASNMQKIKVDSVRAGVPYIVFVIGESYNKHHSAVYGYGLPTTPFQSRSVEEGIMVPMKDAVTPWNVTSMVFKQMFSTVSGDGDKQWTDGVLFPALMRKAGYRVSFFTNQFYKSNRQTTANYNGSFFLNKQPFDSLCFDRRNTKHYVYDIGLLRELPADPMPDRQFIIIHLLGQHQPYKDRIPNGKAVFKVSDIHRKDLSAEERRIVADYDNATLVNDQVMESIYNRFADKEAVIVYVADHGEEVYDGNIGMFGRNHSAEPSPAIMRAEFEVPLEIFVTPSLRQARPDLMESLRKAQNRPFSIDNLPHMLLRLGGVVCGHYDAERDLLSPQFKARARKVKDTGLTYEEIIRQ